MTPELRALHKTCDQIYSAFYAWAARYSADDRRRMFHDTAARV
jgi:predicted TIM-barrel fold metal-dependent hydrolase